MRISHSDPESLKISKDSSHLIITAANLTFGIRIKFSTLHCRRTTFKPHCGQSLKLFVLFPSQKDTKLINNVMNILEINGLLPSYTSGTANQLWESDRKMY